jgi:hypothetical protein
MNIAIFLMLLAVLLPSVAIRAAAEPLLEQLRLDHAAWATAERDFRIRRESGALVGAEASDYAAYVARLQRRVAEDCAALSDAGLPAPEYMSCPHFETAVATRSAAIDQAAEQSRDERIASLEVELASGLADFDELLLREQERVKAAAPRSASGGGMGSGTDEDGHGGDGSGGGEGSAGDDRKAGETGTGGDSTTNGAPPQAGGGADRSSTGAAGAAAKTSRSGATRQPPGIPDGHDDDVVARQLREAAEKESDPELQKKLWEEYRKYKQGTR